MAGSKNDNLYGARLGLGMGETSPTAILELPSGTATAGTGPLKFTSGTNLGTPEAGVMEYDGTNLYYTTGGLARLTLATTGQLPSLPLSPANGGTGVNNGTSTITIGGNVVFSGVHTFTATLTGDTTVTFPTSGTLMAGPGSSTDRAIATWNGTGGSSLLNNSTTNIDSVGRYTNSAQPSFIFYLASNTGNVTGDGTNYLLGTDALTQNFQIGTGMATNGTFTCEATGMYHLTFTISLANIVATHTSADMYINYAGTNIRVWHGNPFAMSSGGQVSITGSTTIPINATDTSLKFSITVTGGTKTVILIGGQYFVFITGVLLS